MGSETGEFACWGRSAPKSGTRVTTIRELADLPNAEIRTDSLVYEIMYNSRTRRATGVRYHEWPQERIRDLFLAYELWHLELWDVFGRDPIKSADGPKRTFQAGAFGLKGMPGSLYECISKLLFQNSVCVFGFLLFF